MVRRCKCTVLTVLLLIMATSHFARPAIAVDADLFADVPQSHALHEALSFAVSENIIAGYPDGTFRPEQEISRVEFIKIAMSALYPKSIEQCNDQEQLDNLKYTDTDARAWYASTLCLAVKYRVVSGYPDGTFKPTHTVTFVEAAKIIALLRTTPEWLKISANTDEWYVPYVSFLSDGFYAIPPSVDKLDKKITRGEAIEMIYRIRRERVGIARRKFDLQTHALVLVSENKAQGVGADPSIDSILGPGNAEATIVLKQDLLQSSFSSHNYLVALNVLEKYKPRVNLVLRPVARKVTEFERMMAELCREPDAGCPDGLRSPNEEYSKRLAKNAICIKKHEGDDAYWQFIDSFLKKESYTPPLNEALQGVVTNAEVIGKCVTHDKTEEEYGKLEQTFAAQNVFADDDVMFIVDNTSTEIVKKNSIILEEDVITVIEAFFQR